MAETGDICTGMVLEEGSRRGQVACRREYGRESTHAHASTDWQGGISST